MPNRPPKVPSPKNPDHRTTGQRGYDYEHQQQRKQLLKQFGCYCFACQQYFMYPSDVHLDHIDGNSKNHDPKNLQLLCLADHKIKTLKDRQNP